ncbi:TniQ family protein [Cupriavidus campinensis]|uniref:TniQ family protein n=1 Tax=Cupriavidus campinensis TaxID=151783 RepID=A0AAE9HYX9_9BURK|nr:TniQ family protein [Cupriavidus campinensis]URF04309.1 TniQ family protein [Cupriavidus campinensis]
MSLVVTYAPRDDESGFGYYRALAAANVLSNWRELAGLAGVQRNRGALFAHSEFVAGQLGLESEWTHFAGQQEAVCRSWGRLHRVQTDAVCPACLAAAEYMRHYWGHTYVTTCADHRILLIDRCSDCGEFLSPNRYHIGQCDCGQDLRMLPRIASTRAQHWLSTLIASAGKQSGGIEPMLRSVDINTLCQVARTLCLHADPTMPALRRGAALPTSIAEAIDLLAPLDSLLGDWPAGFQSHVEKRIAAGKPDARTLNTLLGSWYIGLRKLCQGTALEPFLKIIIEVAAVRFDGALGLDSAKALVEDVTEYVRLADAAKTIGVSVSHMHDTVQAGKCGYRTRRAGTRGLLYEIPQEEVARIQEQRSEWMTGSEACELAGVSPSVLEHMMAAGVVRSDVNWRQDIFKGGVVERRSILELVERIREAADLVGRPEDERVVWAGLTSRRMGDRQAIQSLMQAIAEGKVKAVVRGRKLGDMAFLRADVASYFGTPLLEAGMSIQQLSKFTGWKWESISHWIAEGLLDSHSIVLRGQPCRVVLPHQLLAFRQTYVPLADLARGMGTKSSALSRLLSGIELVGAQQLPSGAARGGLIRVAELGRLAVLGARAGHDLFISTSPVQWTGA